MSQLQTSQQQEKSILEVQAAVYNYDNNLKNWAPKDTGSSRVFIFHNPQTNAYRVIGQSTHDKQYNINTPIKNDLVHKKLRDNFVQWRFRDTIYGLSFKTPEDADRFDGMLAKVVERLQAGPGSTATLPSPITPSASLQSVPAPIPTLRQEVNTSGQPPASSHAPLERSISAAAVGAAGHPPLLRQTTAPVLTGSGGVPGVTMTRRTTQGALSTGPQPPMGMMLPVGGPGGMGLPGGGSLGRGRGRLRREIKSMEISRLHLEENFLQGAPAEGGSLSPIGASDDSYIPPPLDPAIPRVVSLPPGSTVLPPSLNIYQGGGAVNGSQTLNKVPARRIQSTYTPGTAPEGGPPQEAPPGTGQSSPHYATNNPYHVGTLPRGRAGTNSPTASDVFNKPVPSNALYLKDPKDLSARDLRAKEIYTTEESYMIGLDVIIEKYLEPNKDKKVFTPEEVRKIFANIQSIRKMSQDLLEGLRGAMDTWTEETTLGDIFVKMIPFLKIYTEYCNGHKEANQLLDRLKTKKSVATFLKECQASSANVTVDLNALLITPVQRVPRYQLLLQELLKQTPETHPDHGHLKAALDKIKEIADGINESVLCSDSTKEVETLKKLIPDISGLLALKNFQTRQLVKHGKVTVTTSKSAVKYNYLLLFSDIIVFTVPLKEKSKKMKIAERLKLHHVWLDSMTDSSADKVFQLNTPEATYQIEGSNKDEKTLWVDKCVQRIQNQCEKKGVLIDAGTTANRRFKYKFQRDGSVYNGDWTSSKMNGKGTYTFANKNVYEGDWELNKFHGTGVMTYATGEVYDGEWQKDRPHGNGTLRTSVATYDGSWENGMKHGRGTLRWANGDVYEGDFSKDVREGLGTLLCADGCRYEGEWKSDREEGKGTCKNYYGIYSGEWEVGMKAGTGKMEYSNGDVYEGGWVANVRSGQGTMVLTNGVKYEGGWADDLYEGVGKLTKANEVYEGEFKAGRMFGQGKLTTAEGVYEGSWADDRREGKGTWKATNGLVYEGEWHADLQFGKGTLIDVDKSRYDGKFVKGRKEGAGVLCYPSGAKYSGNWQRDKRYGGGRLDLPGEGEAARYIGDWVDDMREGKGTMTDPTGVYEGDWKSDMRNGMGKFTHVNGNVYVGQWKDDRKHGKGTLTVAKPKEGQPAVIQLEYDNGVLKDPTFAVCPPDIAFPRALLKK